MSQSPALQRNEILNQTIEGYHEFDDCLRAILRSVSIGDYAGLSIRKVSSDLMISRTYLRRYKDHQQDVCLRIMNRIANYFDIKYTICNFDSYAGKGITVTGYYDLNERLRAILRSVSDGNYAGLSMRKVSADSAISRTHLRNYQSREQDVCLRIMNSLANYFQIKYAISNFDELSGKIG